MIVTDVSEIRHRKQNEIRAVDDKNAQLKLWGGISKTKVLEILVKIVKSVNDSEIIKSLQEEGEKNFCKNSFSVD